MTQASENWARITELNMSARRLRLSEYSRASANSWGLAVAASAARSSLLFSVFWYFYTEESEKRKHLVTVAGGIVCLIVLLTGTDAGEHSTVM